MKVVINGETKEIEEGITVGELLDRFGIKDKTMAVAIDMQVVKKEEWDKRVIKMNERVEFLHFVGGG
jgi:sulfur carrier protein